MNHHRIFCLAGLCLCLSLALCAAPGFGATTGTNAPSISIIPLPAKMEARPGVFKLRTGTRVLGVRLHRGTRILADAASRDTALYLAAQLRKATGVKFQVQDFNSRMPDGNSQTPREGDILLTTQGADASLGPEGYQLSVTPGSVVIRAPADAGAFYGAQTFLQLLPPEVFATSRVHGVKWTAPCVEITDQPRFAWRGLMLDVSRHFFNKREVESILDLMAMHKLNRFHWHLTDDQGWRIEIKKYPKLTEVGAWRKGVNFNLDPKDTTAYGPDGRYGGYYTQDDIREVTAYAAARHILVVPEIEMPGHSTAALEAYPQYSCTGGPFTTDLNGGVFNGIYCAGNDDTFTFLDDVLGEVFDLFPGPYIHIGGDEVRLDNWEKCAKDQDLMKRENLGPGQVESWFIRRMEKFINGRGRTLIGWSEISQGGLAKSAIVMDWIGGAREAASAGHDVVMSPTGYCYLDHYQSTDHAHEPRAIGGYLPLRKVYSFEPIPAGLDPADAPHILGAQGNLWTEYVPSLKRAEYMIFPRETAMAEVVWSPKESRNWEDFTRRLGADCKRLDAAGANYRHPTPKDLAADPVKATK
jgi:hexosaminidase